jgi:hypothetical protein
MKPDYLFLDDVRFPYEVGNYIYPVEIKPLYRLQEWVIVRNYDEFVKYITENGLPYCISFDHDLGEDEAKELHSQGTSKRQARKHKKTVKSGYDCAKWLIEYLLDNDMKAPYTLCHSLNPVGKENIVKLFENFNKKQ